MSDRYHLTPKNVMGENLASNQSHIIILSALFSKDYFKLVFFENVFERSFLKAQDFLATLDRVGNGEEEISVCYIYGQKNKALTLAFDRVLFRDENSLLVEDEHGWQYMIIFPVFARKFDEHGRISEEELCQTTIIGEELIARPPSDLGCSFNIFRGRNLLVLMEPNRYNIERRKYSIYGDLSFAPLSLGDYLINGKIYDVRWSKSDGTRKCNQEQVGYLLYGYYDALTLATGKQFYNVIKILIAYALALHLPKNGCYRNGLWSPRMETHFRFESEALLTLTEFYKTYGGKKIAQACFRIATAMTQHVDNLQNDMVWFLHDTLENTDEAKNYYPHLLPSCAFGKDPRNTLTLNTHLSSLRALTRYADVFQNDSRIPAIIRRAERALVTVLSATSVRSICILLYKFYNIIYAHKGIPRLQYILSPLKKLFLAIKRRSPALVMPNGAIERDLSASSFSHRYHVVNLHDLLLIHDHISLPSIVSLIQKGIDYTVRENIHRENMKGYPGTRYWPLVLLRSISLQKTPHAVRHICRLLHQHKVMLCERRLPWPVHIFSDSRFSDSYYRVLRDLPPEYDLFEFSFQQTLHWVILGQTKADWLLPDVTPAEDMSEFGFTVFTIQDARDGMHFNSIRPSKFAGKM